MLNNQQCELVMTWACIYPLCAYDNSHLFPTVRNELNLFKQFEEQNNG